MGWEVARAWPSPPLVWKKHEVINTEDNADALSPAEEEQARKQSEGANEHVPLGEADAEAFGDSGNDVAEDEHETDGEMMPDLKGLKQMQKGLQGMLQEATEDWCAHLASADATLKIVLAGCRIV
ncbi:TPA: hypothetical protein ACH3X1_001245 [Trebouxia sp. C0004]